MPPDAGRERKNPWVALVAREVSRRSGAVPHSVRLRARFAETDGMRVVHHTAYFVWFEVARTELLRSTGLPYTEIQRRGFNMPLVEAFANYKAPARYDDEVEVKVTAVKIGRSSLRLEYEVSKRPDGELLCVGHTVQVLVGGDGKPQKIPEDLRERLSPSSSTSSPTRRTLFPTSSRAGPP
jgi:acyl-CoA thioester hydrolase